MVLYLNSGSDFIDARNSYLTFHLGITAPPVLPAGTMLSDDGKTNVTVACTGQPTVTFGKRGSALNLFRRITISDRSGGELERIDFCNVLANKLLRYKNSLQYLNSIASFIGLGDLNSGSKRPEGDGLAVNAVYDGNSRGVRSHSVNKYCVPLRLLCGLFDYEQLLPPQLMSGLKIELQLETFERAFKLVYDGYATVADPGSACFNKAQMDVYNYTLYNPVLALDCCRMTDSVQRELNERSANSGLEIMFRTWYTSQHVINSASVHVESRKAVSRAFTAIAQFNSIPTSDAKAVELSRDSMAGYPLRTLSWQWRAGNIFYPQQPLTPNGADAMAGERETLWHVQRAFGKFKETWWPSAVTAESFTIGDNQIEYNRGDLSRRISPFAVHSVNQFGDDKAGTLNDADIERPGGETDGILVCDLERSTVQDLSGIPLNNSRVLALSVERDPSLPAAVLANSVVTLFLCHLKVARVFLDNVEIEE
jgi:hypothetical protein